MSSGRSDRDPFAPPDDSFAPESGTYASLDTGLPVDGRGIPLAVPAAPAPTTGSSDGGALPIASAPIVLLAGAIGLFLSAFLPLVVLYAPDTPDGAGSLGDTSFNAVQSPALGVVGLLLAALPATIAILARNRDAGSLAMPAFFSSVAIFFMVIVPILLVGTLIAFFPFSGIQKMLRNVGFRIEVGPGAWAAAAAVASMVIASARMLGAEKLERLHLLWLLPRRRMSWQLVILGVGTLVLLATMRILPWVSAEGTVDVVLPYLGPVNRTGDFSVSIGFFPFFGATQFVGVTVLAAGLMLTVLRRGLLGPLGFALGGWLVMIAAGFVASTTLGEQKVSIGTHEFFGVVITRVEATVQAISPATAVSFLVGLAAVAGGLAVVLRSDRTVMGD